MWMHASATKPLHSLAVLFPIFLFCTCCNLRPHHDSSKIIQTRAHPNGDFAIRRNNSLSCPVLDCQGGDDPRPFLAKLIRRALASNVERLGARTRGLRSVGRFHRERGAAQCAATSYVAGPNRAWRMRVCPSAQCAATRAAQASRPEAARIGQLSHRCASKSEGEYRLLAAAGNAVYDPAPDTRGGPCQDAHAAAMGDLHPPS